MANADWGPWENLGPIGEGGGGRVFKVRHAQTGQIGAFKRLKNANRAGRFRSEVEAVKKLNHPRIAQLLDSNLDISEPYAVFEFEPGGSMGDVSADKLLAIPLDQRLEWCEQICEVLKAAHDAGLTHRDIKPDNVLLSEDRTTARLCDFGLVHCEDADTRHTATMEQVGSRFFIPPELEEGRVDEVATCSDIYSMGKLLYYVVSGKFLAREAHRRDKYDLAKVYNNPHFEAISQILDQAITSDTSSRMQDANTMKLLINTARKAIAEQRPIHGAPGTYHCVFCKVGTYQVICISQYAHNEGYLNQEGQIGNEQMVFLECDNCGNSQRFKLKTGGQTWFPRAYEQWKKLR